VCSISNYSPAPTTATSQFLQLNNHSDAQPTNPQQPQQHHTLNHQPGMKLFPNYPPPSGGNGMVRSGSGGGGGDPQYYHQHPGYAPQTLAPLRLSQDHFVSKSNTMNNLNHPKHMNGGVKMHHHYNEPELPIRDEIIANNYNNNKKSMDNLDERMVVRHYH
jgi:hypothetical protein